MTAAEAFEKSFGALARNPSEYFVPYRVCPLGAHIDHQKGIVTGFALDKGVEIAFAPSESSTVRIASLNFEGEGEFSLDLPLKRGGEWFDYAKAAAFALKANGYTAENGFFAVIDGELSAGGLSSSAAVIISYLKALCKVNGICFTDEELIFLAHYAETEFIGLNCGTLDQSCEVLCRKNSLLVLDTSDSSYRNIFCPDSMPKFEIAVFFSGLTRSLVSSNYNLRTEELKNSVKSLKAYANIECKQDVLREIPYEVYLSYRDRLPENQRKRCEHYYSEMQRVQSGVEMFKNGDIAAFGQCIFESGQSSIENYEAGSPELTALYKIIRNTDGIYGGRFSGAGFKGCCMAVINPGRKEEIRQTVTEQYTKLFSNLKNNFSVHFCKTSDGCSDKTKG